MSEIAAWSYTQTLTIWPNTGTNEFGAPSYGTPYTITGSWIEGGDTQTDQNGTEFVPASTYYFEAVRDSSLIPKRESFIKVGNHVAVLAPPADAEKIKKVGGWDMGMFDQIPDWAIYT
jgi:hypothetical protein